MTIEKMNIHKALCELKLLDNRIAREINDCKFVGVTKTVAKMVGSEPVDIFGANQKAQYQKIESLIARRAAIKKAVVLSNATTKVTIGGIEYTIAEAIEMKNHGLEGKIALRNAISSALAQAERKIEITNQDAEVKADRFVESTFGGKDEKKGDAVVARSAYLQTLSVELVDPLKCRDILKKLEDEIMNFMGEVDAALSTSNSLTEIEISY